MSTIQIKVLKGINQKTKALKSITLFICMKTLTTSGKIKNYSSQIKAICSLAKCSKRGFEKRLKHLGKIGFVIIDKENIRLVGWNKVASLFGNFFPEFHIIKYDPENKEHSIESLLNETLNINKKTL